MLSLGASVFYRPKEKAVHADTARLNFARGGGGKPFTAFSSSLTSYVTFLNCVLTVAWSGPHCFNEVL